MFNCDAYSKIIADTPAQIRKGDVFRLLYSCLPVNLPQLTLWLATARPDLAGEMEECLVEIAAERRAGS